MSLFPKGDKKSLLDSYQIRKMCFKSNVLYSVIVYLKVIELLLIQYLISSQKIRNPLESDRRISNAKENLYGESFCND